MLILSDAYRSGFGTLAITRRCHPLIQLPFEFGATCFLPDAKHLPIRIGASALIRRLAKSRFDLSFASRSVAGSPSKTRCKFIGMGRPLVFRGSCDVGTYGVVLFAAQRSCEGAQSRSAQFLPRSTNGEGALSW